MTENPCIKPLTTMISKPILYCDNRSPPVRSVLLLVEELKLDIEIKNIDLFKKEHLTPDYLKVKKDDYYKIIPLIREHFIYRYHPNIQCRLSNARILF